MPPKKEIPEAAWRAKKVGVEKKEYSSESAGKEPKKGNPKRILLNYTEKKAISRDASLYALELKKGLEDRWLLNWSFTDNEDGTLSVLKWYAKEEELI